MFSLVNFFGLPPCNKDLALNYSVTICGQKNKKKDKALQHKLQLGCFYLSHMHALDIQLIFQNRTPSCLMFHNFGCSACTEKPQNETTYLTLKLIFEPCFVDIAASIATTIREFSRNLAILNILVC